MNGKIFTRLLVLIMAQFILSAATSFAKAEEGYWKLEKVVSIPNPNEHQDNGREYDLICTTYGKRWGKSYLQGTVRLTWTKLPEVVIPKQKYSVTVNAISEGKESGPPYWSTEAYFYPQYPGPGPRVYTGAGPSAGAGGSLQGPQTCTYEYPEGSATKNQITAAVNTSCASYSYTYTWISGPPPGGGTENPPPDSSKNPPPDSKGTAKPPDSTKPSGGMALRADKAKASPGETISVPIFLDNSTGLANLNFNLVYDARKVAVGNTEKGSLAPASTSLAANPRIAGIVRIGLAGSQDIKGSGILVKVPFKASATAGGRADLKLEITTTGNASGGKPAVKPIDGWIEIGGGKPGDKPSDAIPGPIDKPKPSDSTPKPKPPGAIPGDVNGNGRLEPIDALQALKMSVGLIDENLIADIDGDGKVTSTDARLILMKAVGK